MTQKGSALITSLVSVFAVMSISALLMQEAEVTIRSSKNPRIRSAMTTAEARFRAAALRSSSYQGCTLGDSSTCTGIDAALRLVLNIPGVPCAAGVGQCGVVVDSINPGSPTTGYYNPATRQVRGVVRYNGSDKGFYERQVTIDVPSDVLYPTSICTDPAFPIFTGYNGTGTPRCIAIPGTASCPAGSFVREIDGNTLSAVCEPLPGPQSCGPNQMASRVEWTGGSTITLQCVPRLDPYTYFGFTPNVITAGPVRQPALADPADPKPADPAPRRRPGPPPPPVCLADGDSVPAGYLCSAAGITNIPWGPCCSGNARIVCPAPNEPAEGYCGIAGAPACSPDGTLMITMYNCTYTGTVTEPNPLCCTGSMSGYCPGIGAVGVSLQCGGGGPPPPPAPPAPPPPPSSVACNGRLYMDGVPLAFSDSMTGESFFPGPCPYPTTYQYQSFGMVMTDQGNVNAYMCGQCGPGSNPAGSPPTCLNNPTCTPRAAPTSSGPVPAPAPTPAPSGGSCCTPGGPPGFFIMRENGTCDGPCASIGGPPQCTVTVFDQFVEQCVGPAPAPVPVPVPAPVPVPVPAPPVCLPSGSDVPAGFLCSAGGISTNPWSQCCSGVARIRCPAINEPAEASCQ